MIFDCVFTESHIIIGNSEEQKGRRVQLFVVVVRFNLVLAHCVEIYSLMAAAAHLSQMP